MVYCFVILEGENFVTPFHSVTQTKKPPGSLASVDREVLLLQLRFPVKNIDSISDY